jgi:catechol 2,3-dioxygenase-like lactoylglutathione lyase family enzyme
MAELPPLPDGIVVNHFIVSDDVERSARFYTEVLGGRVVFSPVPTVVELSSSFIVINAGGGPTDDKPTVTLETPRNPDRASSFLNIRVKDIEAAYAAWSARGAQFLTPPKQHPYETRCYIRDPDGHLIEVGQTTDPRGDWMPANWSSRRLSAATARHPAPGNRPGPTDLPQICLPAVSAEGYRHPVGIYMVMVRRARLRAVPPGLGMAPAR